MTIFSCMDKNKTINLEIELLLEAIYKKYGYDYRQYSSDSITRRIHAFLSKSEATQISELIPMVLYNRVFFNSLIENISVTVTEMFRDPFFFKKIRNIVIPQLKKYPKLNIWVAGCATGEEVYSLAILLKEENIYNRVQIYATDINKKSIAKAKQGIYDANETKINTINYQHAGGTRSFSDYYFTKYNKTLIQKELKENISFFSHNLVTDKTFNKMHIILCRNVLIYFNNNLQNRVLKLFNNSLENNGFLCIGTTEEIMYSNIADNFEIIGKKEKIYKKITNEHDTDKI